MYPSFAAPVGAASSMTTTGTQLAEQPYFIQPAFSGIFWLTRMPRKKLSDTCPRHYRAAKNCSGNDLCTPCKIHYAHATVRLNGFDFQGKSFGADRGNRTLLGSLEGYSITTMLCPHSEGEGFIIHPPSAPQAPSVFFTPAPARTTIICNRHLTLGPQHILFRLL